MWPHLNETAIARCSGLAAAALRIIADALARWWVPRHELDVINAADKPGAKGVGHSRY
jgi:hypothetical protein